MCRLIKNLSRVSIFHSLLSQSREQPQETYALLTLKFVIWLQELLAIQQSGPRAIGFFGTRNMGFMHQQLIEILSYAMVITVSMQSLYFSCPIRLGCLGFSQSGSRSMSTAPDYLCDVQKNHIYTSGASGTNAAVIRGALRAEMPELLTVILPQSLKKQPPESQDLLSKVIFNLLEVNLYEYRYSFSSFEIVKI